MTDRPFDNGGLLPSGLTWAYNATDEPEPVRPVDPDPEGTDDAPDDAA